MIGTTRFEEKAGYLRRMGADHVIVTGGDEDIAHRIAEITGGKGVEMVFDPVGAGLIVHSLTKGISGHGDAMGGAVIDTGLFDWSTWPHIAEPYRKGDPAGWGMLQIRKRGLRDFGATLRPEDAHRIASGLETMKLRIEATNANALALARFLEQQPAVAKVFYPGLESHPQHARAKALFGGRYGALLSFELRNGIDPLAVLDRLRLVILSSHLSDNRTLAIPVAQTIFWELGGEKG